MRTEPTTARRPGPRRTGPNAEGIDGDAAVAVEFPPFGWGLMLATAAAYLSSTRERESHWRVDRDGEALIRLFCHVDGTVDVRFVGPEMVDLGIPRRSP